MDNHMNEQIQTIPARLKNVSKGGHVAGTTDIIDDDLGMTQDEINAETNASLADRYTKNETYNKFELNNMITTPSQKFETYTITDQNTDISLLGG